MNPQDPSASAASETTTPPAPSGLDALRNFSAAVGLAAVDEVEAFRVMLSSNLNQTALHLGQIVGRLDLFLHNGEIVTMDHTGERAVMSGLWFRTWINDHVVLFEKRDKQDNPIPQTLPIEVANTILANTHFRRALRPLNGLNHVPLPVIRKDGSLEVLPYGYDAETGIFTVDGGVQYDRTMDLEAAKGWLRRIFGWAPVSDERSFAVMVAGVLALYIRHLPGAETLKPGFFARGNKPGCGKSVIVKSWQYPVLGRAPAVKMKQGEQLDKEMEAFMIAGVPVIFMDNVYGSLKSATLDQMLSSEEGTGRAMGGHGLFHAKNQSLLMVSGNQNEGNEDAARRFLLLDLFEPADITERTPAEDELLDDAKMKTAAWRSRMLSICWAFVKHWHDQGMARGSVQMQTFERYSWLLGGIVECAGYVNPFTKPAIEVSLNPEQAEFQELLEAVLQEMALETEKDFTLEDLARLARSVQVYEREVGTMEQGRKLTIKEDKLTGDIAAVATDRGYLTDSHRSMFGKKLKKRMGDEPIVKGRKLEFGKRYQARKSTFTVKVIG